MNRFGPLVDPVIHTDWSAGTLLAAVIAAVGIGLLLAASASMLMQRRSRDPAVVARLEAMVWIWSGLLALLMLAGVVGRTANIAAFAVLSFQALREFFSLIHTRRADHWALLAAFFVVLPAQYLLIWFDWYGLFAILLPVYVFLLLPVIPALRGDTTRYMDRIAEVQWGLMISVYCVSHIPALLDLEIPGYGGRQTLLIVFLIMVALAADQVRSEVAHWWQPPRLQPAHLQPTGAEVAAAITTGGLVGVLLGPITPFGAAIAGGLGIVVAMMGLAGRLVLGAIKRDRGIDDWRQPAVAATPAASVAASGGGLLDRLDILIFAAPVYFHLTRFLFTA